MLTYIVEASSPHFCVEQFCKVVLTIKKQEVEAYTKQWTWGENDDFVTVRSWMLERICDQACDHAYRNLKDVYSLLKSQTVVHEGVMGVGHLASPLETPPKTPPKRKRTRIVMVSDSD